MFHDLAVDSLLLSYTSPPKDPSRDTKFLQPRGSRCATVVEVVSGESEQTQLRSPHFATRIFSTTSLISQGFHVVIQRIYRLPK